MKSPHSGWSIGRATHDMPSGQPGSPSPAQGRPHWPAKRCIAHTGAEVPDGVTGHGSGSPTLHGNVQKQPPSMHTATLGTKHVHSPPMHGP